MLGIYNANLIDARGAVIVMPVALFFGGLMQIIVAVLEVFRGNVFGAVVFGTYGPFWVIYGVLLTLYITSIPLGAVRSALALDVVVIDVLAGDEPAFAADAGTPLCSSIHAHHPLPEFLNSSPP